MAKFLDFTEKALSGVPYGQEKPTSEKSPVEAGKPAGWNKSNHKDWTTEHLSDVPLIAEAAKQGNGDADTSFWKKASSDIDQNVEQGKSGTGAIGGAMNKGGLNNNSQKNWH